MNTKYQGLQRARAYGMPRTFARISETTTFKGYDREKSDWYITKD